MSRTLDCAMYYINRGWYVLPLHKITDGRCTCGKADCSSPGKHPASVNGAKDASIDPDQITEWFSSDRRNIGICAGEASGLVVLDIDPAHGGGEALKKLPDAPDTIECLTGGDGRHLYFHHPGGDIRNSAGTIGDGLDVRGHHGYVVAPPSNHISGGEYRWKVDPKAVPLANMPAWITGKRGKAAPQTTPGEAIKDGGRNTLLTSLAGTMRNRGLSYDAIVAALRVENTTRCKPPLDDDELMLISSSVANYPPKNEPVLTKIVLKDDLPTTVARKFEKLSKVKHHWNSIDGWSIYSDNKYQQVRDEKEIKIHLIRFIENCGVRVKKKKGTEVMRLKQGGFFLKDVLMALASLSEVHILPRNKAVCSFNKTMNPATTIALKNGLLSLDNPQKPIIRPFTPDFYTFNYLPVKYDPTSLAPDWKYILGYSFADEDTGKPDEIAIDVVHSWIYRWLLRVVTPHKICALIGDKRSGKSTIGRIVCELLGQTNVSAITIASLAGNHGLYGLMNKQLGVMWDASVTGRAGDVTKAVEILKNISGQDNITVNPKGKDTIDLKAMPLNILMIANKMADLRDSTGALASRFTFLHTTQTFVGNENPKYEANIIKNELSGVLNLVLAASHTLIEHPKSSVMGAEFVEMSSPYTAFANDCCEVGNKDMFIPTDILWAYYVDWCNKFNHRAPSAQKFKLEFPSAIPGLRRIKPRINYEEVLAMKNSHQLDRRPGQTLTITDRPQCYSGIDMLEHLKGDWNNAKNEQEYGQNYGQY